MARDYAKKTRSKTTPAAQRRTGNRKSRSSTAGAPGWAWALSGLALGLFVAFLVYLNENRPPPPKATTTEKRPPASETRPAGGGEQRPRFDFYTILPEQEVVVPENPGEDERAGVAADQDAAQYLLQAGSFRTLEQADSLRARLVLLGVEASIETVRLKEGDTWHRVRVGPFNSVREVAKIQERLRRKEIQTLRVKIKG